MRKNMATKQPRIMPIIGRKARLNSSGMSHGNAIMNPNSRGESSKMQALICRLTNRLRPFPAWFTPERRGK